MLARYDKTGSILGTAAFDKFLRWEGEGRGEREGDVTVPLYEEDGDVFGARQAIVMGFSEREMIPRGLKGLESVGQF